MAPKVLVTRIIPERPLALLKEKAEVSINLEDRAMPAEEMIVQLPGKVALLSMGGDPISAKVLEAGKELKIVANDAVGFNNIDLAAATRWKIAATNTPEVLTDTTADLTFALILGVARRVAEADRFVRAGKWVGWKPDLFLGSDIHGKTLGIIGFGRIGMAMAQRALGFNMPILYTDVRPIERSVEERYLAKFVSLKELLREADFITLHVALTPETIHLIGREELGMMKRTAFLINASRGPVIDEKALVEALKSGMIAGAGLDVFEEEPRVTPELLLMDNVLLLPHIGSATFETREKMALVAVNNILSVLRGEIPPNILNPEIYR
ncbi:MAG: D-glycerate dehydrogenase [Thermodesulfobacteriota bacterium]|nr:D-glycerate dehydrogenase [Thermodesulfobacteriota bacterium]